VPMVYKKEDFEPDFSKLKGMTIGLSNEYFIPGLAAEVQKAISEVIEVFRSFGVAIKKISLPHTKYALSTYYIVMPAEVSANLARYDGVRYGRSDTNLRMAHESTNTLLELYKKTRSHGFGAETKRRVILGTFVLSSGYYDAYYSKAQKVRALIKKDFTEAFREVDLILSPTTPTAAFALGEKTQNPLEMYLSDIFTIPANLAGIPAISIPAKVPLGALPIGFQLMARSGREMDLINVGSYYEKVVRPEL